MSEQPRRRRRQEVVVEEVQAHYDIEDDGVIEQPFGEQEDKKETTENTQKSEKKVQKKHTRVRKTQKTILVSIITVLLVMISVFLFSIFNTSNPVKKYSAAQELMAKGKYDKAADKFESLGSYEDATTLTMYCKACALCESGNYEAGLAAFETLGDFKDSIYRITYYTARAYEEFAGDEYWEYMSQARSMYNTIPVFLDSAERISILNKQIEKAKANQYNAAVKAGENGNYTDALNRFGGLGNYKDSEDRYAYYQIRESEDELGDSADQDKVIAIAGQYTNMGTYLDCADRAAKLIIKADTIVTDRYSSVATLIDEGKYSDAESILASFGTYGNERVTENYYTIAEKYLFEGSWENASATFKKAGNYNDAANRISEARFKQAEEVMNNGEYDKAIAAFKKLNGYGDSVTMINECNYRKANELLKNEQYSEAYGLFSELDNYKDVSQLISSHPYMVYERKMEQYTKWELVSFGQYAGNDITWSVLSNDGEKILLACQYVLDVIPEHSGGTIDNWATSTQRAWLNGEFYSSSFSATEKQCILSTILDNGNTTDNVFVLSAEEAYQFYSIWADDRNKVSHRHIGATSYAISKGVEECAERGVVYPTSYFFPTRDGVYSSSYGDRNVTNIKGDSYLIPCIYVSLDKMP